MKKKISFYLLLTLIIFTCSVEAMPIHMMPGLKSITFYEASGATLAKVVVVGNTSDLNTRLSGTLGSSNRDFEGVPNKEFYDVFYSDENGNFKANGEFVTIECKYDKATGGGGLNIAKVELNFVYNKNKSADNIKSYFYYGSNQIAGSADNAVDGNLTTSSSMGNTANTDKRLRITVGWSCNVWPNDTR